MDWINYLFVFIILIDLTDCLKELDQLIFLFVDRNPMDFLEKKNRETYFTHLDPAKLIPILEKYVVNSFISKSLNVFLDSFK